LCAQTIQAKYKVTFGIFGEIGIAEAALQLYEDKTYEIHMHVYTTGFASFVSGNRREWFSSNGKIEEGFLVPDEYKKIVKRDTYSGDMEKNELITKTDIRTYTFSHVNKKIVYTKEKIEANESSKSEEELEYYAKNDLLSLFFNFKNFLPSLHVKEHISLVAVGANKTDGRIDIYPLEDKKLQAELSWHDGKYLKVVINEKIFASEKGELFINLNEQGIAQSAVLKDVIFFGDIRGEMIE
jgi:hypothetical protein